MPSLITLGAVSGRGFGATNPVLPPVLTTTTFTSSGNWIAPLSVASVASIYGYGQNGSPQPYTDTTQYWALPLPISQSYSPYAQWGELWGQANFARNTLIASIGGYGPSSVLTSYEFYIDSTTGATANTWSVPNANASDYSGLIVNSVGAITTQGYTQTSGNILANTLTFGVNGFNFDINFTIPGFQGSSSTGLGKTFPGGNGTTAPLTSFSNVAVTPGVSYPISVAPGGSVTLQYYV